MAHDPNPAVIPPAERLPAAPIPDVSAMVKQLLDQLLANERRRLRNEQIRISVLLLLLLVTALGSGLWIVRGMMRQVQEERRGTQAAMEALLARLPQAPAPPADAAPKPAAPAPRPAATPPPEMASSDTATPPVSAARAPATGLPAATPASADGDARKTIADLEARNRFLMDMLEASRAPSREDTARAEADLRALHARLDVLQRAAMSNSPPAPAPAPAAPRPSLTVLPAPAVPMRLPIPAP